MTFTSEEGTTRQQLFRAPPLTIHLLTHPSTNLVVRGANGHIPLVSHHLEAIRTMIRRRNSVDAYDREHTMELVVTTK